jgi:hypothetical protein
MYINVIEDIILYINNIFNKRVSLPQMDGEHYLTFRDHPDNKKGNSAYNY